MTDYRNTSDLIEAYLKEILRDNEEIEIRRSQLASQFHCVPSQINYVIKTRFSLEQGYQVKSKRGGGGYIRIMKLNIANQYLFLNDLKKQVPLELSYSKGQRFIEKLEEENLLTSREKIMLNALLEEKTLGVFSEEKLIRSAQLIRLLERLGFESKEEKK